MTIKVMIVDDSAVVRQVLTEVFSATSDIQVSDVAMDPIVAMDKMKQRWPDVIVLDVEMPRMDGITFLKQLMSSHPTPVVICSSLTQKGTDISMQALAAGAVEVIAKPTSGVKQFLQESNNLLVQAVRGAAAARMSRVRSLPATPIETRPKLSADAILTAPTGQQMFQTTERIVAIGTSTGGTQALETIHRA